MNILKHPFSTLFGLALRILTLLLLVSFVGVVVDADSVNEAKSLTVKKEDSNVSQSDSIPANFNSMLEKEPAYATVRGALLTTRFSSFEEFKKVVRIEYFNSIPSPYHYSVGQPLVRLTHSSHGRKVTMILKTGVSEADFMRAKDGGFWERALLVFYSPYCVIKNRDLLRVYVLSRRRPKIFKEGDVAFYDLAETMMLNISKENLGLLNPKDLSEKGFINTFNHITSQAFMTSIFSERMAEVVADAHERHHMPELITGKFTQEQIKDVENGPVDNYVDVINNAWGRELGKVLSESYNISRETYWTPELMADYLNDVQMYFSWAFQVGFYPFKPTDVVVIRFASKINNVMKDVSGMRRDI